MYIPFISSLSTQGISIFDGKLCQKYLYQQLLKSDNCFSSYSWKCWECFFETQCI